MTFARSHTPTSQHAGRLRQRPGVAPRSSARLGRFGPVCLRQEAAKEEGEIMHRVERPTKRRGLPFYLPAALALLAVMIIQEAARAQQWSCAKGFCSTTGHVGVGTTTPSKSSCSNALTVIG